MFENYEKYLAFLNEKLQKFFENQKPFIFCHKGCAKCCKNAQFPYSLLEIRYLLSGFLKLDKETQDKIEENLQTIVKKKKKFRGKIFKYECPFLIDDVCSVYEYRGVICRTFGLMTNTLEQKLRAPFCYEKGLNYSNVMNIRTRKISPRKYKKLGVKEEPLGFNVSYKFLTDRSFEEDFNIRFGEVKPLINWFLDEVEGVDNNMLD